jgi:hypothetical protein
LFTIQILIGEKIGQLWTGYANEFHRVNSITDAINQLSGKLTDK